MCNCDKDRYQEPNWLIDNKSLRRKRKISDSPNLTLIQKIYFFLKYLII